MLCRAECGPVQTVICCRDQLSVPTVETSRDEKDQMKSRAQEASLFRGVRFGDAGLDVSEKRPSRSKRVQVPCELSFWSRGEQMDGSVRVGGRPARLAALAGRSSWTGGNERSYWGILGGGAWEAAGRIRVWHELLGHRRDWA